MIHESRILEVAESGALAIRDMVSDFWAYTEDGVDMYSDVEYYVENSTECLFLQVCINVQGEITIQKGYYYPQGDDEFEIPTELESKIEHELNYFL